MSILGLVPHGRIATGSRSYRGLARVLTPRSDDATGHEV